MTSCSKHTSQEHRVVVEKVDIMIIFLYTQHANLICYVKVQTNSYLLVVYDRGEITAVLSSYK